MLYHRGYYHRWHPGLYAYWQDFDDRVAYEKFKVIFKGGKVAEIEETSGDF